MQGITQFPPFYPIVDVRTCAARGIAPLALAEACLRGGARLLQLRDKDSSSAAFLALADRLVLAARTWGARVIVNDRVDVAAMAGAAGVHLGQEDLPVEDARRLLGPDALLGLSTHDPGQVEAALASAADYLAVGPVYETATKQTGYRPRGLELVRVAAGRGRPVVAIGGVTLERAPEVRAAGADSVAVIGDLLAGGGDPERRTREFLRVLGR